MMRAALPKPQRKNLAQRQAEASRFRERRVQSAKQMLGPVSGVQLRPLCFHTECRQSVYAQHACTALCCKLCRSRCNACCE